MFGSGARSIDDDDEKKGSVYCGARLKDHRGWTDRSRE